MLCLIKICIDSSTAEKSGQVIIIDRPDVIIDANQTVQSVRNHPKLVAAEAQDESSLSVRIAEALKTNEANWKYIGYAVWFDHVASTGAQSQVRCIAAVSRGRT